MKTSKSTGLVSVTQRVTLQPFKKNEHLCSSPQKDIKRNFHFNHVFL